MLRSLLKAGSLKALEAVSLLVLTIMMTRLLGASQSGIFLLALSILATCGVFFRVGLDGALLRFLSADKASNTHFLMTTGLLWVFVTTIPVALIAFIYSNAISVYVFSKGELAPLLSIFAIALPMVSMYSVISVGFQSYQRMALTVIFQNLGVTSLFMLLTFIALISINIGLIPNIGMTALFFAFVYLVSVIFIFAYSIFSWNKQINGSWGRVYFKNHQLWNSSSNFWSATSMGLAVQWAGVLIAGALVSSSDVAFLSAAQRSAGLVSFILTVVNIVVAPQYARLWAEGDVNGMKNLSRQSSRIMLMIIIPMIVLIFFASEYIMALFGSGFEQGAELLVIMTCGQLVNVVTGSVGFLLSMSGHERDYRRVTFFAGPLTIILSFILIQEYGVIGAAVATAVGLSVQNIGALFMVKLRLGFWPLG